jgi:HAD superfamily hydrolase (TIGR01549 family)
MMREAPSGSRASARTTIQTSLGGVSALLLDVGGVLMDERHTYRRFRRSAAERIERADGRDVLQALRAAIRDRAPRASQHALLQLGGHDRLSTEIWSAIGNADRPYPEARDALEQLARHYRLAIVGNQSLATRARLQEAGLLAFCDSVIISGEVGLEKPDPRIFQMALNQLGIEPPQAAMVGDRLDLDIGPARRLGLCGVRMLRGPHVWQRPHYAYEQPDLTVRSLAELCSRLAKAREERVNQEG